MMKLFFALALGVCFQTATVFAVAQPSSPITESFDQLKLVTAKLDSNNTVLSVKVGAPSKQTIEAVLTHSIGWVVEKKTIKLEAGTNIFSFNMAQLAEGSYRLILRNANSTWTASQVIKK